MEKQQYTSQQTSISVVNKVYTKGEYVQGANILDYGGGKYDKNIEYMAQRGCRVVIYDPYNRSNEYNKNTIAFVNSNPIQYIVCSNVLNVIKEDNVIAEVITNIVRIKQRNPGCKVYISVYEGDKTGKPKETAKGWQRNQKTDYYVKVIQRYMAVSKVSNGIIICD